MHDHAKCRHKPGKIVIIKEFSDWVVVIWGGDGDHPIDGAIFDTHAAALHAVRLTLAAWWLDSDLRRSVCLPAGLWCEDHDTWRPCPGCD